VNCLLQHAVCVTLTPRSVESTDLRIRGGVIVERGRRLTPKRGEEVYDLAGRVVMPGLVCAHTHLYSSLSRGMPMPARTPANFLEILRKIWWKLDRALDEESIYYSALAGALDAARCGTTTIIDHHASPSFIAGSLDIIKEAVAKIGTRGVLCYEVTDRGGKKKRDQGLDENERFIRANKKNGLFRGLVGAHASFTLSDESLRLCGEMASRYDTGVHIHAAEDMHDEYHAWETHDCSVIERLARFQILRKGSILAHCVHPSSRDIAIARAAGCSLVHNPRSNMNNRVGYAPIHLFGKQGALGTDGFPADMFEESKFAFHKRQDSHMPQPVDVLSLLDGGQRAVSGIFGGAFGTLAAGAAADLVVLDYQAPTPMTQKNCGGHFLFGMQSSMVESVMTAGKWIVKDRAVVGIDADAVYEKARRAAKKLWKRMEKL
jgi:putative selenium metabolism protein SsnA